MPLFMLFSYLPADRATAIPDEEENAQWEKVTSELLSAGAMLCGEALGPPQEAVKVEVKDEDVVASKLSGKAAGGEVCRGYYLIDVVDRDAAVEWASRLPSAADGYVEVRPVEERQDGEELGDLRQAQHDLAVEYHRTLV